MSAAWAKLKKPFAVSSKQPPEQLVYFIDRSLGKHLIADALRAAGARVEVHDDHLEQDAPDEAWIALVGRQKWIAVTKDKNVRFRTAEIEAIKRHGARALVQRAKNATGSDMAGILVNARPRLERFVSKTAAPFVAGIDRLRTIRNYPI